MSNSHTEREIERVIERDQSSLLIHSPECHSSNVWTKSQPGDLYEYATWKQEPALPLSSAASPQALARRWTRSGATRTGIRAYVGCSLGNGLTHGATCWSNKLILSQLCYNVDQIRFNLFNRFGKYRRKQKALELTWVSIVVLYFFGS